MLPDGIEKNKQPRLFLIDGSALVYRAYFAFIRNPLINSKGENTSAVFGFVNSLLKIIKDERPEYLAVILDTKAPTFRHELYKEYKSTRVKMPEDLVVQLPRIHEATEALRIATYSLEGYEADDIIATMAKNWAGEQLDVYIVSGDKDLFQLVNEHARMYLPQRGSEPPQVMDRDGVKNKTGVYPDRIIDYLALTGDSSDNVPGIPGVGPKTALALLQQFGDFDSVLGQADRIESKGLRAKVSDNEELARLSYRLVTLDCRVPINIGLDDLRKNDPDPEKCRRLFTEMEFFSLLKELGGSDRTEAAPGSPRRQEYKRVGSLVELKALVERFSSVKELAIDTETDSLNSLKANLVGISLATKAGEAFYIPIAHTHRPDLNLQADKTRSILAPLLKAKAVQKVAHNFKFDLQVLENAGYKVEPISFDTMLASYVINPSSRGHSLDSLALEHFNHQMTPITDLIGSGKKQTSFAAVDPDTAAVYSAEDADFTFRLRGIFAPKIEELKLGHLYYDLELPLIPVLSRMERIGVRIDPDYLNRLGRQMRQEMDKIAGGIFAMAGEEFNINSTQQLGRILFDKLHLRPLRKTAKKTAYATDVGVLEELSSLHPLPRAVLEYRQLNKLISTYVEALPKLIDPDTGRVHTSFNQAVTATGRLSSSDPNLQNIPVRTETGREIRKAFIPSEGPYTLLVADYSQIELRILAHFSEDPGLIKAFQSGEDIHARTAAEVYGVPLEKVTPQQRRAAKTANFAVIYGVSAYGLSQQTELNVSESRQFIDTYFARYPNIRKYMEETIARARSEGYVSTLLGRRRHLPEIQSKNFQRRQFAERTAINTPIQGTAADLIKLAMIKIDKALTRKNSKMILQVHDELIFDAYLDEVEKLKDLVVGEMSKAIKMKVPLVVDVGVGANWLEAK